MRFTWPCPVRDGIVHYQALYDDAKCHRRSAGTFPTEKAADKAWQRAEARMSEGRMGNPSRGWRRFRTCVEQEWFLNHQIEARTRESYTYYLDLHILPLFGSMRMIEVKPSDVREWITHLQNKKLSLHAIRYCKTILSAIFTTALNDVVHLSPPVAKRLRAITTPEQFDKVYKALPSQMTKLLAETDIESGLRWGELTELRPRDIDFGTRLLTVSRVVVGLTPRFHPEGGRFLIKDYPKDQEHRQFKLSPQITAKIEAMSWPAEIDMFLAIGELSLYVAYLDGWSARHRVWPWVTALIGLSVSVAANIGHIQPQPGHPVILADRLTAATSPLAAFAGLSIGLLVLKMTREHQHRDNDQALSGSPDRTGQPEPGGQLRLVTARHASAGQAAVTTAAPGPCWPPAPPPAARAASAGTGTETDQVAGDRQGLLRDASLISQAATASGGRLSQRALARELRSRGHRFSNEHLHDIAASIGLAAEQAA